MVVELIFSVIWYASLRAQRHPTDPATGHCLYRFPSKPARFVRFRLAYPFCVWSTVSKVTGIVGAFFFSCCPLSSLSVSAYTNIRWDCIVLYTVHLHLYILYTVHLHLLFGWGGGVGGQEHNFWKWTILIRPSHPLLWVCVLDMVHRHRGVVSPFSQNNAHRVMGHSMSKGITETANSSQAAACCCL